jgi:hypothetical protein
MTAPVSANPGWAVQVAIVAVLKARSDLTALLAGKQAIYDGPPETATYPYVAVGDHLSIDDNTHGQFGREVTETIHVWTKTRTNSQGQKIADIVTAALDHQVASLSAALAGNGHRCVSIRQEYDQALRDPDPQIRHHVLRFRIETQQLS